ncbi:uncharacterized protein LOC143030062 [Oratosquilla oratoria]|uniref:uncharacterized protein LOC143030062 n=1 Tax=Oratosquilla oratoria TaxID=337810 RepID=UPI003F75CE1A
MEEFTYLGSTISDNFTLGTELNKRVGKAASTMARFAKRVCNNTMSTINTKMKVYQVCVFSTQFNGSESWTLCGHQGRRLDTFHLRCRRRILGRITSPNTTVLVEANIPSMFVRLTQRYLHWVGHVSRMDDGRIP